MVSPRLSLWKVQAQMLSHIQERKMTVSLSSLLILEAVVKVAILVVAVDRQKSILVKSLS